MLYKSKIQYIQGFINFLFLLGFSTLVMRFGKIVSIICVLLSVFSFSNKKEKLNVLAKLEFTSDPIVSTTLYVKNKESRFYIEWNYKQNPDSVFVECIKLKEYEESHFKLLIDDEKIQNVKKLLLFIKKVHLPSLYFENHNLEHFNYHDVSITKDTFYFKNVMKRKYEIRPLTLSVNNFNETQEEFFDKLNILNRKINKRLYFLNLNAAKELYEQFDKN